MLGTYVVVYYSGASLLEYVKIEEKRIILFIMTSS